MARSGRVAALASVRVVRALSADAAVVDEALDAAASEGCDEVDGSLQIGHMKMGCNGI